MRRSRLVFGLSLMFWSLLMGCQFQFMALEPLPTRAEALVLPIDPTTGVGIPVTFTPLPETAVAHVQTNQTGLLDNLPPTKTPLPIPTNTPVTPTSTPTNTATPTPIGTPTAVIKPINQYSLSEVIPFQAFPVPSGNNGWGMHWIPTVSQEKGVVDQFVAEVVRMHIKWVVFLNEGTQIGDNDYLVERLVANGIMPVMRLYRSGVLPYDGNIGPMVAHYRAKGVYYFQLYNEPNVNVENHQGFANPNQYAEAWAAAAREVIANGGFPGLGALSPGGEYNHYDFLARTLQALKFNGDEALLNRAWLSVHNYHGVRPYDDPDGFLLFRKYDEIVQSHLGRSLPMIGTEGGSYSADRNVELELIRYQYTYMRDAEPYFLAFSYWLLANRAGGAHDSTWEWQALFKPGFVHPAVTEFFYKTSR
ncbi:MAG: hypothetical protein KC433_16150 [Anaerolineales bacterium]|nr:hypothetical protein [Anaerolineales bacterium]MCB8937899.1 hypothetical protein [Ardenticatenaceae bacterium]